MRHSGQLASLARLLATAAMLLTSGRSAQARPCHVSDVSDVTATIAANAPSGAWRAALKRSRMRVSARSVDGSEASRLVPSPAALSAVAFGLLASAPAEPPSAPEDPLDVPPPALPGPPPQHRRSPQPFEAVPRLDVSASFGARAGFPTDVIMGDFEVRADLFIHEWIFDLSMRAAPFSQSSRLANDLDAYQEASLGLGLGREVHLGPDQIVQGTYPIGLAPFPVFTVGLRLGAEVAL